MKVTEDGAGVSRESGSNRMEQAGGQVMFLGHGEKTRSATEDEDFLKSWPLVLLPLRLNDSLAKNGR